jgi:predicted RNA methylase
VFKLLKRGLLGKPINLHSYKPMFMFPRILVLSLLTMALLLVIAQLAPHSGSFSDDVPVRWVSVEDLPSELEILETVFWEPLDTESLRQLIRDKPPLVTNKSVLEIGTGSGLLALCCSEMKPTRVVATDINPHAIRCAKRNARRLGQTIDFRLVPSGAQSDSSAFSVLRDEKFDLIISNPPWEDDTPKQWSDYALYDANFQLLRSILEECREHLNPGGRVLLAYGCVDAILTTKRIAKELGLTVLILDDREPESLPSVFLPGMMVGILTDVQ